jgi:organic hydroperoxide reductase OsmC/OhrA
METGSFSVDIHRLDDYRMEVDFHDDGVDPLIVDEPEPLGQGTGPNASRLLAAAVGNCLAASLLFCLRKSRIEPSALRGTVRGTLVRNEQNRLRIGGLEVRIHPTLSPEDREKMKRCADLFEDFCLVTASVRNGIDIEVALEPEVEGEATS